jgi:carbonic anhydrase/acetyltransferase-like protein (isoleucine patch superfamily)
MLRRVALVRTDISEELARATRCNIPEDTILHSHCRENLKSYKYYLGPLCLKIINI